MAGEEGSSRRRRMDLNLYVSLPPLPQPRDTSGAFRTLPMANSTGATPEAPRTGEPEKSIAPAVAGEPDKKASCGCNSNFECNICFDVAKEPVVTSCGHLFCWPCLYRWHIVQSPFTDCPVCKGEVLKGNITPIYGRGSEEEGHSNANPNLPPRPQANRRESVRHQLQMAGNAAEIISVIRQLTQNQGTVGGLPTPDGTEMALVNAAQEVLAAPRQPSALEHLPTSSTAAAIWDEPGSSSQSGPSESPNTRRTRRRGQ